MGRWQLVSCRRSAFDLNSPINTAFVQCAVCTLHRHLSLKKLNFKHLICSCVLLFFSFLDPTVSNEQLVMNNYVFVVHLWTRIPPPLAITSSLKRKSVKEHKSCSTMNLLRACVELIYEYWIEWIPCHMVPCPRVIIHVLIYIHHQNYLFNFT